ncbi:DUF4148 domain-containing protein [Derxia lacustris]|uniref:DUF4148 domain-containing protein n=1 Tax=Derxia lacustris TaxID=764842 RepID=UPI001F3E91CF|nr:DUF4148 domain-containing protein [Derxia lacustris]
MKTMLLAGSALALSLLGGAAQAASLTPAELAARIAEPFRSSVFENAVGGPALTREQVRAELAEAIRRGDAPIAENGLTPREANPAAYPARGAAAAKTREQVRAELAEAIRLGQVPLGEDGRTPRERQPEAYPAS